MSDARTPLEATDEQDRSVDDRIDLQRLDEIVQRIDKPEVVDLDDLESFCTAALIQLGGASPEPPMRAESPPRWQAGLSFALGHLDYAHGRIDAAASRFSTAVELSRAAGDLARQARSLRHLALCHEYAGRQVDAIDCVLEALALAEGLDDPATLITSLSGLLALYESQGAYDAALDVILRIHRLAEDSGDDLQLARSCAYAALFCGYLERADEGLEWLDACLRYCKTGGHTMVERYSRLYGFWLLHVAGRSAEAIRAADEQLEVIASLPAQNAAATYVDVAEVHLAAGNYSRAEEMLQRASERAGDELRGHLIRYYQIAAELHEARGQTATALRMLRRYTELLEELRGRQARARLVMVERRLAAELAEKTAEIHHLRNIELVDKNEQLAALNRQKDEILRVVAHDLRSPVAAVAMLSDLALHDQADSTDTDLLDQLGAMRTATNEMSDTIDRLLHLRGVEDAPHGVALDVVVAKSIDWATPFAADRSTEIHEDVAAIDLVVEEALVRRALDDVLWVLLHAVNPGEPVYVQARPATGGGGIIEVSASAVLDDAAQRTLYIGRRLVERMGGSLTIGATPERSIITIALRAGADVRTEPRPDQPSVTQP